MISLELARRLQAAGLVWEAGLNDFFAIPDRGMDERLFVVADMLASLDVFRGWPVVTFHGTAEWSLDYILTMEVIWMPREDQLRQQLADLLQDEPEPRMQLGLHDGRYRCTIQYGGAAHTFEAADASDAYGLALLHVLQRRFGPATHK